VSQRPSHYCFAAARTDTHPAVYLHLCGGPGNCAGCRRCLGTKSTNGFILLTLRAPCALAYRESRVPHPGKYLEMEFNENLGQLAPVGQFFPRPPGSLPSAGVPLLTFPHHPERLSLCIQKHVPRPQGRSPGSLHGGSDPLWQVSPPKLTPQSLGLVALQ